MNLRDRELIAGLCAERAGLRLEVDKPYLFESRLGPLARREGFGTVADVADALRHRADERLIWATVEAMAAPDTSFFRDPDVFEHLRDAVLPELARQTEGPVRVWSVGCSTGQEVYSLAMLLAETPTLGDRVELFASDLNERSLEKAQAGTYSQFEVQRGLPASRLVRHFAKADEAFALSPQIRSRVRWRRVNLLEDLGRLGRFELVLCRNVLSGLTREGRSQALDGLRRALAPHGALVLGLRERLGSGELPNGAGRLGVYRAGSPALALAA